MTPEVKVSVPISVETAAVVEKVVVMGAVEEMKVSVLVKQMAFLAILKTPSSSTSVLEARPSTPSVLRVWCSTRTTSVVIGLQFKMLEKFYFVTNALVLHVKLNLPILHVVYILYQSICQFGSPTLLKQHYN